VANEQSDDNVFNTFILAAALFFGGIVSRFKGLPAQIAIFALALAMLSYGPYNAMTFPIV
jgi:hypothetical protein